MVRLQNRYLSAQLRLPQARTKWELTREAREYGPQYDICDFIYSDDLDDLSTSSLSPSPLQHSGLFSPSSAAPFILSPPRRGPQQQQPQQRPFSFNFTELLRTEFQTIFVQSNPRARTLTMDWQGTERGEWKRIQKCERTK